MNNIKTIITLAMFPFLLLGNYMDDISEGFDNLSEKYKEINEDTQNRLDDPIGEDAKKIAGEKRVNVYKTESQIIAINTTTRMTTKLLSKDLGTTLANLTELSAEIQEVELLSAELKIAQNDFKTKEELAKGLKKDFK